MSLEATALQTLAQPANDAAAKLRHNAGGLGAAGAGLASTRSTVAGAIATAVTQRSGLADLAAGATADRAAGTAANLEQAMAGIQSESQEIQRAVEQAASALGMAEHANQQNLDQFLAEAAEIMKVARALRAATPPDTAGAQALLQQLVSKAAELSGRTADELQRVMGELTRIADGLGGGQATTASAAGGGGVPGGVAVPGAFNSHGGGGASGGGGAVGGGIASKPRLPVAVPPQPGTGVAVNLPGGKTVQAPNEAAAKAVRSALGQLGVPYVWGGTAQGQGLDCSGLTMTAYRDAGIDIPRLAQEQTIGAEVPSRDQLLPGDLVVWSGHVAMVIGDGHMVEAGDPVQVSPIRTENSGQSFIGFYRPTG